MYKLINRKAVRQRIRYRIRKKVGGTAERPRVAVFRSLKHVYAQAIDDVNGKTLMQASSQDKELRTKLNSKCNLDTAKQVGQLLGERMKAAGISSAVFDRGGFIYHGRIKALAEAVRASGVTL
jgi:large subunit ribosomal protein L18